MIRWATGIAVLFLGVMTLLRFGTYSALRDAGLALDGAGEAFVLGLRYDARVVAVGVLALLALGSVRALNPFHTGLGRRLWLGALTAFSALLVIFYAADFLHHRYLNQRLNASALGFLADAKISAGMVWETYPVVWIGLGMVAAVALLTVTIGWMRRRAAADTVEPGRGAHAAWLIAALVVCAVGIYGRVGQYPLRWSDAFNLRNDTRAHLALNPFEAFFSSLSFRASGYDLAQVRKHQARMREYLGVAATEHGRPSFERQIPGRAPTAATVRPPNVVLVICESFSGYKSSMWGNPLDPTPFFAGLCREGVFFDNCFTPHIGTARGVWATITGIPDVEPRKTASRNPALVDQHTIVADFEGYEKLYFLGGSTSWANIRGLLTNNIAGLRLYEEDSFRSPRVDVWGISDKSLFLEAHEVLRAETKPFFAVIQTAGNHRPYSIAKEDKAAFESRELGADELKRGGFESNAELNAMRYMDFAFQQFMEAARRAPYFENTVFVFIGDHGIGGNAGTMFPAAWTEQNLTCYHVPLLFYAPKLLPAQRVHAVASMVDLLPTVAGVAGIPYRNTALGRDLLQQQQIDGGRSNVAFVIDHHSQTIGAIQGAQFGSHQRGSARDAVVWADFARPATPEKTGDAASYRDLAEAFYETSRYLLFHNQKGSFSVASTAESAAVDRRAAGAERASIHASPTK